MAGDPKTAADDESLAIRIMCGDREALREVLEEHLQQTRDLLTAKYHATLHSGEINEAISAAVLKLLKCAHQYDKTKGGIGGWFFTMAQTAALDIMRREKRYRRRHRYLGPENEPLVDYPVEVDGEPLTKEENQRLRDLNDVIEKKLTGLQQAIVKADLAAGEPADAGRLAEMYRTTRNSIYVSRNKAHERIKKEMLELEERRERFRGKK